MYRRERVPLNSSDGQGSFTQIVTVSISTRFGDGAGTKVPSLNSKYPSFLFYNCSAFRDHWTITCLKFHSVDFVPSFQHPETFICASVSSLDAQSSLKRFKSKFLNWVWICCRLQGRFLGLSYKSLNNEFFNETRANTSLTVVREWYSYNH